MLPCSSASPRVSQCNTSVPVVHTLLFKSGLHSQSLSSSVRAVITHHLRGARRLRTRRTAAVVSGKEVTSQLNSIFDGVSNFRKLLNDKRVSDELAQQLCDVFHLDDKTQLQDFLASIILSECVYKKVEASWETLAETIGRFALEFPPGFVDITAVQCSLQDVTHNYILASSKSAIYIAFMGTKQPRDLGADVNFLPEIIWEDAADLFSNQMPPAAHRGFHARAKSVDIRYIHDLAAAQGKRLVLCGHSLGAAVAKLCTIRLMKQLPEWQSGNLQCFCFAAPAVGNAALADLVDRKGWGDYIHSYLMPEDTVIRLVSLAQQNGFPFTALAERQLAPAADNGLDASIAEELLLAPPPTSASPAAGRMSPASSLPALTAQPELSENQAATELASISLDEGEACDAATLTAACCEITAAEQRLADGASMMEASMEDSMSEDDLEEEQPSRPASRIRTPIRFSKRRWALKQLRKVARRARGTWASAASRMMSKYIPFGNHYFILPTNRVISLEQLQNSPPPPEVLGMPEEKGMQGPFTFHRMKSYRGRINQIIAHVGGPRLSRWMDQPRAAPTVAVVGSIFPAVQITSAVAWLPLLASPAPSRSPLPTATLSSLDDLESTPTPPPSPPHPSHQSDPSTRAAAVAAAAAQPRGLGVAVPLPARKASKTVAMMLKVDGVSLKQCRSMTVRLAGQQASFPVEVTNFVTTSDATAPTPNPTPPTPRPPPAIRFPFASLQQFLRPVSRQPWVIALAPFGIAAGKLLQTVLTTALAAHRHFNRTAHTPSALNQTGHAVLRVHLPQSVVRKLHNTCTNPAPSSNPSATLPQIELVARTDFHEVVTPIELRPNKVAVLGTTSAASRLVHAALSGQLDLPVGPGNPSGILPYWLRQLPSLNPFRRKPAPQPSTLTPSTPIPTPTPPPAPTSQLPTPPPISSPSWEPTPSLTTQPMGSAVAAMAAAVAAATSVTSGATLTADATDVFALNASRNSIVAASSRLSAIATPLNLRKRYLDSSLDSVDVPTPTSLSLDLEPAGSSITEAKVAGSRLQPLAGGAKPAAPAPPAAGWRVPTQMLATLWAAPARLARAASGGLNAVRGDAERPADGPAATPEQQLGRGAEVSAELTDAERFAPLRTPPPLRAEPAVQPVAAAAAAERLTLSGAVRLSDGSELAKAVPVRKAAVKLALSAPPEAATEAGRRLAATSAWRQTPRAGLSRVASNPDLNVVESSAGVEPAAAPQAVAGARRWGWFGGLRRGAATPAAGAAAAAQSGKGAAVAGNEAAAEASRLHAGVLYEHMGGGRPEAVEKLVEGFRRQQSQVSWWTALWMALRANTAVASWPSTIGVMALVGRAMMALPTAPAQLFNLLAENASNEHVHAMLLVHQAGADESFLKSEQLSRLVSLAKAADVAIVPVVLTTSPAQVAEVIMAQYAICQACGVPLGCERVILVDEQVAADPAALQSLPSKQRRQLGKSLQELWHHLNQELLAKQLQLVNILPSDSAELQQRL